MYVGVREVDGLWCEVALSVSKCLGKVVIFVARSVVRCDGSGRIMAA